MMDKVLIRSETSADVSAIAEVTAAAFKTLAIGNHVEFHAGFKADGPPAGAGEALPARTRP